MEKCLVNESNDTFFIALFTKFIEQDPGRIKLLERFGCKSSFKFEQVLTNYDTKSVMHIGSGSYADVYRLTSTDVILKIIRLLPEVLMDRIQSSLISRTSKYIEAYNEFQISNTLSKLHKKVIYNNIVYACKIFPYIVKGFLTKDDIPERFYSNTDASIAPVDIFDDFNFSLTKENLVIFMEDCGGLMTDYLDTLRPNALLSILKQIIVGFAIAEIAVEFEHRDLHSGNILLQQTKHNYIQFILGSKKVYVPAYGYRVKIIDTTFSRLKHKNKLFYKDMTHLFENFNTTSEDNADQSKMKMQDVVYHKMAKIINNNWQMFFPKTNLLWIKYVIYKLLKAKCLHSNSTQFSEERTEVYKMLMEYDNIITNCATSFDCFNQIFNHHSLNKSVRIIIRC